MFILKYRSRFYITVMYQSISLQKYIQSVFRNRALKQVTIRVQSEEQLGTSPLEGGDVKLH